MSTDTLDLREFGGVPIAQGSGETFWNFGWIDNPGYASFAHPLIEAAQGFPMTWEEAVKASTPEDALLLDAEGEDDNDVFLWKAEESLRGKLMPSLNQSSIGSCVSVSYARTVTDLIAISAVQGLLEWPGINVAPEPIYGGSRVEVGRGVLGSSDGSLGSWASSWLLKWGVLLQKVYGSEDLTEYSVSRCRSYGLRGCPDPLEPIARQYPVKGVALVTTGDQLWQALGSWYPVNVCSNRGFTTTLRDGFCEPSGSWAHAMTFRGRFVHPTRGKCVIIQNSWGDYLRSNGNPHSQIETKNGKVQLPEGCFATTLAVAHAMVAQRDSYALSDIRGFLARRLFFW